MEVLAVQNQYPTTVHYASDWKSQLTLSTPTTGGLLKSQPEYIFKATSITNSINNKSNNTSSNSSSNSSSNCNSKSNSDSNSNSNISSNSNNHNNNRHNAIEYQQYNKLKSSQQKQLQQQQYHIGPNQCQLQQHTKHLQPTKRNHNIFYFHKKPNTKQQLQQQQLQNYVTKATILTTNTSNSSNKLNCDNKLNSAVTPAKIETAAVATAAVPGKAEATAAAVAATTTTTLTKCIKSAAIIEKNALKRNENEYILNTTAVQELSQRLLEELRAAKSRHLTCTEVHIPCDLTSRIALQILKLAHEERNGLRDCIIYIEFEDEPNNSRRIATLDLLNKYRQRCQWPIYEIYVTLRQDYPGWTALLPQFIKHLSRTITISPQFNITKHKPYYSAKSHLR